MKRSVFFLLVLALVAACERFDETPEDNGVDDVKKACEIRATWTRRGITSCDDCIAVSQAPTCGCPAFQQPYIARCVDQSHARVAEPSCDGTLDCVGKCNPNDCDCVDRCYAGKDLCREVASALDGCVADVCDAYCR